MPVPISFASRRLPRRETHVHKKTLIYAFVNRQERDGIGWNEHTLSGKQHGAPPLRGQLAKQDESCACDHRRGRPRETRLIKWCRNGLGLRDRPSSTLQATDTFGIVAAVLVDPFHATVAVGSLVCRELVGTRKRAGLIRVFSRVLRRNGRGNTAWVSFPPHSSRRKSLHLRPFNFPETFAATYRIEHAGTAKAALAMAFAFDTCSAAGATSGDDFSCAPFESAAAPGLRGFTLGNNNERRGAGEHRRDQLERHDKRCRESNISSDSHPAPRRKIEGANL